MDSWKGLSALEAAVIDRVAELAALHIGRYAAAVDEQSRYPEESLAVLRDDGLLGLTVSSEYGGMGRGVRVACAALEVIAGSCASTAMVYLMHLCGVACYMSRPQAAATVLREVARGQHLSTLAFSERGSRSHFWAPVSLAEMTGNGIEINAEKSWVTSAGHADGYVVSTGLPQGTDAPKCMLYLVFKSDTGFSTSGVFSGLGMRGNASSPVKLERVKVDAGRALCDEGMGLDAMLGVVLPIFQLGVAAISIGIAEAAVVATQGHMIANRFEHTNERLADLPVLRARLAAMRIETDRARAHLASVIHSLENPDESTPLQVLAIKASSSETALRVTEAAMRACGGAAFSKHLSVERNFRDARAAVVMAPTTDHAYEFIGRAMCGMELLS